MPLKPLRLDLELVPATAWFSNIRGICSANTWTLICKRTYKAFDYRCGICGGKGLDHPVECHETWHYGDLNHVMALTGLIALCPDCHSVKHMGFTQTKGSMALKRAIEHMAGINRISIEDCLMYISYHDDVMMLRSQYMWSLNHGSLTRAAPELLQDSKFLSLTMKG